MNNVGKAIWRAGCFLLAAMFLVSCGSAFIPSSFFSYAIFFALLFPYLFVAVIIACVANLFLNKKWAIAFLVLLFAGFYNLFRTVAISPLHTWKMQKEAGSLRIMTWNVSDFENPAPLDLPDAVVRRNIYHTITEYKPDVLCLQEYYNADTSRDLPSEQHELDSLGYHYVAFSNDERHETFYGIIKRGTAIFSKLPVTNSDTLNIRRDWNTENVVHTNIAFYGKTIQINTGHLMSYYLFPDSAKGYNGEKTVAKKLYTYKRTVGVQMRDIEDIHESQATRIAAMLNASAHSVIYCGDMNATPVMYSYRLLQGNRQDAFLQAGNGIGATFYNIAPTLRIDVIFPDKNFTVIQCTVVHRKLGDHDPVVADLRWK